MGRDPPMRMDTGMDTGMPYLRAGGVARQSGYLQDGGRNPLRMAGSSRSGGNLTVAEYDGCDGTSVGSERVACSDCTEAYLRSKE